MQVEPPHLSFEILTFSRLELSKVIAAAAGFDERDEPHQVTYLGYYLSNSELHEKTMVVERPYVDRHFLAEYQGYYATALRDVARHTTRVHFFNERFEWAEVASQLASEQEVRRDFARRLQRSYIGFTVIRPLPSAPIGRSVLRWYDGRPARRFGAGIRPYIVHLWGLTLQVDGFPFQQQDQAVGACATTAVWCALAAAIRRDGGRSPTPLAITEAAHRSLPTGRSLPASGGLTDEQMAAAVNAMGYAPDLFKVVESDARFLIQVMTYVRSGIPVIFRVCEAGTNNHHAIAVVGFREADESHQAEPLVYRVSGSDVLQVHGLTRLYIHDDRLGPYARVAWVSTDALPRLEFQAQPDDLKAISGPLEVNHAIAPLYPKIRINASDLLDVAVLLRPLVKAITRAAQAPLVEMSYALSGDYLARIYDLIEDGARALEITSRILLSRYVGVLRYVIAETWTLDALVDVTDIPRDNPPWSAVLAILPADAGRVSELRNHLGSIYPHIVVM